jgi:hypothetical protein
MLAISSDALHVSVVYTAHLDIPLHPFKVQAHGLLVEVSILLDLETRVLGDRSVISPRRTREVNSFGMRVESGLQKAGSACDRMRP